MVSVSRDPWISEERAGKELMQEKGSGVKLNSIEEKQEEKKLLVLFPSRGGRRKRVKRPRETAIWLWLYSSAKLRSS